MATGEQADLGGIRVDRPLWAPPSGPAPANRTGAHPTPPVDGERRLPRMRQYEGPGANPAVGGPIPPARSRSAEHRTPRVQHPVDVDLTAPDPTRRPVDIDLTVPVEVDLTVPVAVPAAPTARPAVSGHPQPTRLTRPPFDRERPAAAEPSAGSRGSADVAAIAAQSRRRMAPAWIDRRIRRVRRRLRPPQHAPGLTRPTVVVAGAIAALVVGCTVATVLRTDLRDQASFLEITAPLHRDPEVADELSRHLANSLVADGAVPAGRALDAKLLIEDAIIDDAFGPPWRAAMRQAHDQAIHGRRPTAVLLDEAVPGLTDRLRAADLSDEAASPSVRLVQDGYVTHLSRADARLGQAVRAGGAAIVVLLAAVLVRTRNRFRASGVVALATAAAAVLGVVLAMLFGEQLVSVVAPDQVRSLATGVAPALLSTVRMVLLGVAAIAAVLAVVSRLEEVRVTPRVAVDHPRRRRRSGSWGSRPVGSRSHDHRPDHGLERSRRFAERRS